MPRKTRENRTLPKEAFLHPINIYDFGDPDKDPCFGKLYNITASECQMCGDFEFCGIVFAQNMAKKRLLEEKKIPIKDLELTELEFKKRVKDFYLKKIDSGEFTKLRALKVVSKRFSLKISKIKQLITE